MMKKEQTVKNMRKGWWDLSLTSEVPENASPVSLSMGKRSVSVLREIGIGEEYVYVLQYSDDVKKAVEKGHLEWNCKIGRSRNATQRLLSGVSSAYLNRLPEVGLMIRCEDSVYVEAVIHNTLRFCKRSVKSSPGHEWFNTSPDVVSKFYIEWLNGCKALMNASTDTTATFLSPPYSGMLVQSSVR